MGEECDDANDVNDDKCTNGCKLPICGDGIVQAVEGKTCDPPVTMPGAPDDCRDDCTFCGDGIVNGEEQCDLGNENADSGSNFVP